MKLSKLLLSAMSAAVLSSCCDKSKLDVTPKEQVSQRGGSNQPNDGGDPNCCPACGMG